MGREALPEVWNRSVGPPGSPGRVGKPERESGMVLEALPGGLYGSGGPLGGLGRVGSLLWRSGIGREALSKVRDGSGGLSGDSYGPPGGSGVHP